MLLCAGYFLDHMPSVQDALIRQAAGRALRNTRFDLLDKNRLSVVLCGTGTTAPDRERASACTAVFIAGQFFLVDVSPSSARKVGLFHLPSAALSGILLTHFHSDHIGDLGEINTQKLARWTGPSTPRVWASWGGASRRRFHEGLRAR